MTWKNRIIGHGEEVPDQLLANPKNWRVHPKSQQDALGGVLAEVGIVDTVLVNKRTGFVVDGHLRVAMAISAHESTIPVTYLDLSEQEEALVLATFDPVSALAVADSDQLKALLAECETDNSAVKAMLEELAKANKIVIPLPAAPEPQIDKADELREKWGTAAGQVWVIPSKTVPGKAHKILCGDCTDGAQVDRLLGGCQARICWTDPPWNVAYGESNHPTWKKRQIVNDNLGDAFPKFARRFCAIIAKSVVPGAPLYMAMSAQEWPTIDAALRAAAFHWSSTIIWVKDHAVLSRKDYHTRYEPVWYGWKDGAPRLVPVVDRTQNDVWEIPRPLRSDEHPTMKPVELVARSLANSSQMGDLVFEPFLGSGPVPVAAEQLGRLCAGIDIEPKYVAVTLQRLADMGLEPRVEENAN